MKPFEGAKTKAKGASGSAKGEKVNSGTYKKKPRNLTTDAEGGKVQLPAKEGEGGTSLTVPANNQPITTGLVGGPAGHAKSPRQRMRRVGS